MVVALLAFELFFTLGYSKVIDWHPYRWEGAYLSSGRGSGIESHTERPGRERSGIWLRRSGQ